MRYRKVDVVICVHEATLYSIPISTECFAGGRGLHRELASRVLGAVIHLDFPSEVAERLVAPYLKGYAVTKTDNRKVMGSVVELCKMYQAHLDGQIEEGFTSMGDMESFLNQVVHSSLPLTFSREQFQLYCKEAFERLESAK